MKRRERSDQSVVNGNVHAVHVDQVTDKALEHARFIQAIHAGEQAVQEGRTKPAEQVFGSKSAAGPFESAIDDITFNSDCVSCDDGLHREG